VIETNLASVYNICSKIDSEKFKSGLSKMPIFFKNKTFTCYNCDSIGGGDKFYVNRSRLLCKDLFALCVNCVMEINKKESTRRIRCNACSSNMPPANISVIESRSYITGDKKDSGVVYVCRNCSETNRLDSSYELCSMCHTHHGKLDISDRKCKNCISKFTKCEKCGKRHLKDNHERAKIIVNPDRDRDIDWDFPYFCESYTVTAAPIEEII
jgi:hypothetical protein